MIGKQQIVLDASDWIKGVSSGENITDGGFSPTTQAVNLKYDVGVLNGVPAMVDKSTNLTGNAIAYTPACDTAKNGYILASDGKISSINSSQVLATSSALTGTFSEATSDIINFFPSGSADKIYATSQTDVARMDIDLTGGVSTWWSVTLGKAALNSSYRHPFLNYIGYVFFPNGNVINRIESSTAGTENVLVLNSQNQITALGIDISTGQMLIATTHGANGSGTIATGNRVFVWDGVSSVPSREIPVDGMITGFRNVGGVTYCAYPQSIGYWNGSGVTLLRRLSNVTLTSGDIPYKNHLSNIGETLYVVDGNKIMAYGDVLPGRRVWYPALYNTVSPNNNFSLVCTVGDNKIGVGFATAQFYTFDTVGTGVGDFNTLKTNRISFPRPVFIRSVNLEYAGSGVANGYSGGNLYYRTQAAASSSTLMSLFPNNTGSTQWEAEGIIGISEKVKWVQFIYVAATAPGLRRMTIYYDVAE